MATDSIRVSAVVPVPPSEVLRAWLDSAAHSAFTGGVAFIEPVVGGRFTAWDGYIAGTTIAIEDGHIVQTWRTTEFPEDAPDSRLELHVAADEGGTLVTLVHSHIPGGQGERYEDGWVRWYLTPMRDYFGNQSSQPKEFSETGEFPAAGAFSIEEGSGERGGRVSPATKRSPKRASAPKKKATSATAKAQTAKKTAPSKDGAKASKKPAAKPKKAAPKAAARATPKAAAKTPAKKAAKAAPKKRASKKR